MIRGSRVIGNELVLLAVLPVGDSAPTVFDTDFLKNVFQMKLNGIEAHVENNRYFPVRFSCRHPTKNLLFAFTERGVLLDKPRLFPRRRASQVSQMKMRSEDIEKEA